MRTKYTRFQSTSLVFILLFAFSGCSNSTNTLAPFEPEINSSTDSFQFQATQVERVTTTETYLWTNTGNQAKIDHSSAITNGSVSILIYDNNDSLVYSSPLVASGSDTSQSGLPGSWKIRVLLDNCWGTLNFRVQKM